METMSIPPRPNSEPVAASQPSRVALDHATALLLQGNTPMRPLKRVEYDRLAELGCFEDEKVELLFGMVIPMSPIDPAHEESKHVVGKLLERLLGGRALVRWNNSFAASDVSEPEPDVMVVPDYDRWHEHPSKAFLVVEVARSSLRRDKGPKALLYGLAEVDEYWIVNHVDDVIEVYRDRHAGDWRQKMTYVRGQSIAMAAFPDVEIEVSAILPPVPKP
jgi:Uma2 family endonuclease